MQPFRDATPYTCNHTANFNTFLTFQYHETNHYDDVDGRATKSTRLCEPLVESQLGKWKTCQSPEREATPERILFHAGFGSHPNLFSYGISPLQHYTMIEHAKKVVYPKRPKRKQSSSTSTFARVYLRLRFAAQAVLKARRNGEGNLSSRAKSKICPGAQALQRLDLRQRVPSIRPQKWVCT
jgi:hypothetical protein